MDLITLLKIIAWTGGLFISGWIIKLLREINSKQKEYISLIEKAFQEREKTRDQKIELLDVTHKKEIELIEREKSIFFKSMESEKKNLELRLSNSPSSDNALINNLITELKADLSLVVTKVSNLNIQSQDLSQMKEIVGIAGDINRKVNFISNEESNPVNNGDFNKQEKINLKEFILEIFNSIYSTSSFKLDYDESLSNLRPIVFRKQVLYIMLTEIFSNVQHHSPSRHLKIYGSENPDEIKVIFENPTRRQKIDVAELSKLRIVDKHDMPNGLFVIKDIMKRYKNEVNFELEDNKFRISLVFK